MAEQNEYLKGFVLGTIIGGVAGALTALLLAPKSGKELRDDIAQTSTEIYGKASDYFRNVEGEVNKAVNQARRRAQDVMESARTKAENILADAENVLRDARTKAGTAKENVQDRIESIKDATKAGIEAFQNEMREQI